MGSVSVTFSGDSISQKVSQISNLREYNDESLFFSGVFRRSNVVVSFENTSQLLNRVRNNQTVEFRYHPNNPNLNSFLIFRGLIDEGSTQNNITQKEIQLTVVDVLKLIDDVPIEDGDQAMIDQAYGSVEIALDREYITNFLNFIKNKGSLGFTFDVGLTIESIFPPTDSYYTSSNTSALGILQELVKATNSFMVTEGTIIFIKPRPRGGFTGIKNPEIISLDGQTDGYNKIYNSIIINNSEPYVDQSSIRQNGVRTLNISTYAAPTRELADTYLSYYKDPKKEMNMSLRMTNLSLALKIGDGVSLNVPAFDDLSIQAVTGNFFIISREMDFQRELVNFRLRQN